MHSRLVFAAVQTPPRRVICTCRIAFRKLMRKECIPAGVKFHHFAFLVEGRLGVSPFSSCIPALLHLTLFKRLGEEHTAGFVQTRLVGNSAVSARPSPPLPSLLLAGQHEGPGRLAEPLFLNHSPLKWLFVMALKVHSRYN